MKQTSLRTFFWLVAMIWLGGCAVAPSPYGGAPVVDRSVRPPPPAPPPSQVEVNPLNRPAPIVPQEQIVPPPTPGAPGAPSYGAAPEVASDAVPPAQISRQGNPAVVALLDSAAGYVSAGELDKAANSLESALRIEPRNAGIWYDLAQVRLHQRQYQQAESMATKSNSLAGGDRALQIRNWQLISVARRAQGNPAGADEAEAQATILKRGGA